LWFITSNFLFQVPTLKLQFRYKYIFITNWFYIMYIMHSCPLSHKYEQHLLKSHFWNIYNFYNQKHFWTKCVQLVIKRKFINSNPFAFLIINVKILSNF
jgi:hypothetical protein